MDVTKANIKELLYKPGPMTDLLGMAEKKTGLDRMLLLGLSTTFLTFWLGLGYGAGLLCGVIGFLYPAYESVKALHEAGRESEKRWLTYWVVFSFFQVLEFFSDHLVWWVPLYWLGKTVFLVWCMAPINYNGSAVMYTLVIEPFYVKYQRDIDTAMDRAVNKASGLLEKATDKAKEVADNQKSGLLDLAVEKVKDVASNISLKTD
jgi:receptor expression-enhancing protein 5/6